MLLTPLFPFSAARVTRRGQPSPKLPKADPSRQQPNPGRAKCTMNLDKVVP
jgi:hypothetical protein